MSGWEPGWWRHASHLRKLNEYAAAQRARRSRVAKAFFLFVMALIVVLYVGVRCAIGSRLRLLAVLLACSFGLAACGSMAQVESKVHGAIADARTAIADVKANKTTISAALAKFEALAPQTGALHQAILGAQNALASGDLDEADRLLAQADDATAAVTSSSSP